VNLQADLPRLKEMALLSRQAAEEEQALAEAEAAAAGEYEEA
jgi:hypothetical protein